MLSVLDLFTIDEPRWTVDGIATSLGFTQSTAYRYVSELCGSGLIAPMGSGAYALGPRIIELDRQIRQTDPLVGLASRVAPTLLEAVLKGVVTLASVRGDAVLSVFQAKKPADLELSFDRGRSMGLFRGAAAKAILVQLPRARLTKLFLHRQPEIAEAGLGPSWVEFWGNMQAMRRRRVVVSRGEAEPTSWGVAAPVVDAERSVFSSITLVMPADSFSEREAARLSAVVVDAAEAVTTGLASTNGQGLVPTMAATSRRRFQ